MKIKSHLIRCMRYILWFVFSFFLHTGNSVLAANRMTEIDSSSPPVILAVDLNRDGKIKKGLSQIKPEDIAAGKKANDVTTPALPYRFWVNNDLDVVNNNGFITRDSTNCDNYNSYLGADNQYQQTCEQWDEDPATVGLTNTSISRLQKIESDRDLEDFVPLLMYISKNYDPEEYTIKLKAVGVSINLFKSEWDDKGDNVAHKYIFDEATTKAQINTANGADGHFPTVMNDGEEVEIDQYKIDNYFNSDGEAKFIFEAVAASPQICSTNAENCYLELELSKKEENNRLEKIWSNRLYLDIHDIKDYYEHVTAGSAQTGSGSFHATYLGGYALHANHGERKLDIYSGLFPAEDITQDLIVLVHGWRMRDSEKVSFAETSFKRLYWSGYKSQFTTFSWPTGWFNKPAHAYDSAVIYVIGDERNYDVSDVVARQVGLDFRNWLVSSALPNTHVIAHSMGNVVVSEALKYQGTGHLITSYTASQAATAAGSYDSKSADMQHELHLSSVICPFSDTQNITTEEAWRCYNIDNELQLDDTPFDMPPDMYRNDFVNDDGAGNLVVKHGPTSSSNMGPNPDGNHHFKGISTHVDRILNFYNEEDAALTGWEFNQLTKPDFAQGLNWFYTNSYRQAYSTYEICLLFNRTEPNPQAICADQKPDVPAEVISEFQEDGVIVPYNEQNKYRILGFAVPARTEPLGQASTGGEINDNPYMSGFTTSNQDHSAPFHGYLSQKSPENAARQRAIYWNTVLTKSLLINPNGDGLTGLNDKNLN